MDPEEAVKKEMSNPKFLKGWCDHFLKYKDHPPAIDTFFSCGAGITTFNINAYGMLTPCIMANDPSYALLEGDFMCGWQEVIPRLHDKKTAVSFSCARCEKKTLCGYCPPFFKLETGKVENRSEFICRMGQLRHQFVNTHLAAGGRL